MPSRRAALTRPARSAEIDRHRRIVVEDDRQHQPGVKMFKRAALISSVTLLAGLLGAAPALAGVGLSSSPSQLAFGEVDLHYGGSPRQSVNFYGTSPLAPTAIESVEVQGAEAARFQIVGDGCLGDQLEMGEGCSIEVEFDTSGMRGVHSATLALTTSEGPLEVPLSGDGATGTLTATPDPLSFAAIPYTAPGTHNEGENSENEQVEIQNSANASTQIATTSIVGPDASSFSIQYDCGEGDVLGTNNSCGVGVRFQPTSPGPKSASLVIDSDAQNGPLVVPLEGEGRNGPKLSFSATQSLLGDVALGSSAQQALGVTNTGDYPLLIQRTFLVSGTPLMFPVLSDSCSGQILYPSESCTITVGFQPTTLGEKDASLLFITNAPMIGVAGFDGVGVRGGEEPSLALPPLTSAPPDSTSPAPAAPIASPPPLEERQILSPPALSALRAPRLYALLGHSTLDPGADVQCPASAASCEVLSYVVVGKQSRSSASGFGRSSALLGSALAQLRPGQGAHVRVALSQHALALLRGLGQLRVRVGVVVQADGAIIAEHSWSLRLTSAGAVTRTP
jgi:Abnormal spindle-like microcephaly-assoc'd, ASPM-SPD-2-Hydin